MYVFAIGAPGLPELLVIAFIVLLLFGAGKLPQVFESFGKGMKSFKDAQKDDEPATPNAAPHILSEKPVDVVSEAVDVAAEKVENSNN